LRFGELATFSTLFSHRLQFGSVSFVLAKLARVGVAKWKLTGRLDDVDSRFSWLSRGGVTNVKLICLLDDVEFGLSCEST
jgi:hypothetical protein